MNKENKVIGITASAFDLCHAGHLVMLEECKSVCDYLVALLQIDPSADRPEKSKPVESIVERQIRLKSCKYVDEIYVYSTEEELKDLLLTLKYDIRILGVEYQDREFTGREIPGHLDKCYFNRRDHKFSSSELRSRLR